MHWLVKTPSFWQSTWWRHLLRVRSLRINRYTCLDEVLHFLNTKPAKAFIRIHRESLDEAIITVSCDPAIHEAGQCTRAILGDVIQRTIQECPFKRRIESSGVDFDDVLQACQGPLRVDTVLCCLSKAGRLILEAATAGCRSPPQEVPSKTPTECLAALLDALDAGIERANHVQQAIIMDIIRRGELQRLRCRIDISSIMTFLDVSARTLAAAGLHQLQHLTKGLSAELASYGVEGPPLSRLLDNVYGRVWESTLNAKLMEDIPPMVVDAARVVREELGSLIEELPSGLRLAIEQEFVSNVMQKLPRPWADRDVRLRIFTEKGPPNTRQIREFFCLPAITGYEVAGDYFIGLALFEVLKRELPNDLAWRLSSTSKYVRDVIPLKGRSKFLQLSTPSKPGSGITLAHQHIACDGHPSMRAALVKVWDLDDSREDPVPSANILAIKQGLPYCTGISGHMHIYMHFFLEVLRKRHLDLRHAILGLLIYMVCEGGHPWNEGLQTVSYLESVLEIRILPEVTNHVTFVADYSQFVSIFDGCSTQPYLANAIQYANEMTILYRRKYIALQ